MSTRPRQVAGDPETLAPRSGLNSNALASLDPERGLRGGSEEDRVVGERGEAVGRIGGSRQQGRCHPGQREYIHPQQLQGFIAPRQPDLEFQQRAGLGHLGTAGEDGIDAFVEAAAWPDHLQVRFADQRTQAAAELAQRRFMHGLHRHAQGHAEDNGDQREQRRQPPPRQRTEEDRRQPHPCSPSGVRCSTRSAVAAASRE